MKGGKFTTNQIMAFVQAYAERRGVKWMSMAFTLLAIVILVVFGERDSLEIAGASRLQTLTRIMDMSAAGNYFQTAPGLAMETVWEDPAPGLAVSILVLLGNVTGLWSAGPGLIYVGQFLLMLPFFLLPFWGRLFNLPAWFYPVIPVFILFATVFGHLFFSWTYMWAKALAVLWGGATLVHLSSWWKRGFETFGRWGFFFGPLVIGFGLGLLGMIRRSAMMEALAAIGGLLAIAALTLVIRGLWRGEFNWRGPGVAILVLVFLILGSWLPPKGADLIWWGRDQLYEMKDVPRNPTHPVWAPLYLGLGYVKNDYGIRFDDGIGAKHVKSQFPNARYGTADYERALRTMYFQIIFEKPLLLVRSVAAKTIATYKEIFAPGLLLLVFYLVWATQLFAISNIGLAALLWTAAASMTPILAYPASSVLFSLKSGLYFWLLVIFAMTVAQFRTQIVEFLVRFSQSGQRLDRRWVRAAGFVILPVPGALILLLGFYMFLSSINLPNNSYFVADGYLRWQTPTKRVHAKGQSVPFKLLLDGARHTYKITLPVSGEPVQHVRISPVPSHKFKFSIHSISYQDDKGTILETTGAPKSGPELFDTWYMHNITIVRTDNDQVVLASGKRFDAFLYPKSKPPPETVAVQIELTVYPPKVGFRRRIRTFARSLK